MKILFITDLYPVTNQEKYTPKALHNFVKEWIKQGHKVDVIKPNFIFNNILREKPFYRSGVYEYEGVKIFNLNYFTPFWGNVTKKIPKSLNIENYDVIISHMPAGTIFANKLSKKYNKDLVCGVHISDIEVLTKPLYKFYFSYQLKDAYKRAKKIACRSFVLQKKFSALFPALNEKTFIVASGVQLIESNTQNNIKQSFTIHRSLFTILTCANLIKRKNIDKLIWAIRDLKEFKLKIIGEGKELKKLKKIKAENVEFLGLLDHSQVLKEMQNADIFILPSINETFGLVYLEAMASGCITVCTKNDGIDGIIKDGENGFLCEPTIQGIKEIFLTIKKNNNLEQIRQNSLKTVKKYTPELCAEKYLENL